LVEQILLNLVMKKVVNCSFLLWLTSMRHTNLPHEPGRRGSLTSLSEQ